MSIQRYRIGHFLIESRKAPVDCLEGKRKVAGDFKSLKQENTNDAALLLLPLLSKIACTICSISHN